MRSTKKEIIIPFSGFYNSIHDANIDNICEQENEYLLENNEKEKDFFSCDYGNVWIDYAKEYVKKFEAFLAFEHDLDITLEFKELDNPKFYNYSTNRIVCLINNKDIIKLYKFLKTSTYDDYIAKLKEGIKEDFSSRDGFISFYSNDFKEWLNKGILNWDCNELNSMFKPLFNYDNEMFLIDETCFILESLYTHNPKLND